MALLSCRPYDVLAMLLADAWGPDSGLPQDWLVCRGFLIATTLFCALHVCNIAVHFYSFRCGRRGCFTQCTLMTLQYDHDAIT